jgi:hypothetical protein
MPNIVYGNVGLPWANFSSVREIQGEQENYLEYKHIFFNVTQLKNLDDASYYNFFITNLMHKLLVYLHIIH